MNILPNPQQLEIIEVIRTFLANEVSVRRYQEAENRGAPYSSDLWQQLVDLGWFGIGLSEEQGGMGLTLADEMLLAREAGRQLVSPTVLATSFATHLLAKGSPEGEAEATKQFAILDQLIAGNARVALMLANNVLLDHGKVSGDFLVLDGAQADYVVACCEEGCFLFSAELLEKRKVTRCSDESLLMEDAYVVNTSVIVSSQKQSMKETFGLFLIAALAGITEATRDAAAAYACEREQFGRPIGSFQAISHMCADMAVSAEASWSQCIYAALAFEEKMSDASTAIASGAVVAAKSALNNARNNVQIHGGVGFTVEYDAHYYVKRSHVYRQLVQASISSLTILVPR